MLKLNEEATWAVIALCIAAVCVAIALNAHGCQNTATITCADGTTYSTQAVAETPKGLGLDDAEAFCASHGGTR